MIARPKISRNEWKTAEIGAFEVGNFALLSCPAEHGHAGVLEVGRREVHGVDGAADAALGDDDDGRAEPRGDGRVRRPADAPDRGEADAVDDEELLARGDARRGALAAVEPVLGRPRAPVEERAPACQSTGEPGRRGQTSSVTLRSRFG